jgi:hypothetical protein
MEVQTMLRPRQKLYILGVPYKVAYVTPTCAVVTRTETTIVTVHTKDGSARSFPRTSERRVMVSADSVSTSERGEILS